MKNVARGWCHDLANPVAIDRENHIWCINAYGHRVIMREHAAFQRRSTCRIWSHAIQTANMCLFYNCYGPDEKLVCLHKRILDNIEVSEFGATTRPYIWLAHVMVIFTVTRTEVAYTLAGCGRTACCRHNSYVNFGLSKNLSGEGQALEILTYISVCILEAISCTYSSYRIVYRQLYTCAAICFFIDYRLYAPGPWQPAPLIAHCRYTTRAQIMHSAVHSFSTTVFEQDTPASRYIGWVTQCVHPA